jgi:hypothetical protein
VHLGDSGSAGEKSGRTQDMPQSAGDNSGSTSNLSGKNIIIFGNTAGAPENHSYH